MVFFLGTTNISSDDTSYSDSVDSKEEDTDDDVVDDESQSNSFFDFLKSTFKFIILVLILDYIFKTYFKKEVIE